MWIGEYVQSFFVYSGAAVQPLVKLTSALSVDL
jgi:hypothetical protein